MYRPKPKDEKVHSVGVTAPSHTLPSGICEAGYLTRKWLQVSCISLFNDLLLSLNFSFSLPWDKVSELLDFVVNLYFF